jgi:hypothetical protein
LHVLLLLAHFQQVVPQDRQLGGGLGLGSLVQERLVGRRQAGLRIGRLPALERGEGVAVLALDVPQLLPAPDRRISRILSHVAEIEWAETSSRSGGARSGGGRLVLPGRPLRDDPSLFRRGQLRLQVAEALVGPAFSLFQAAAQLGDLQSPLPEAVDCRRAAQQGGAGDHPGTKGAHRPRISKKNGPTRGNYRPRP